MPAAQPARMLPTASPAPTATTGECPTEDCARLARVGVRRAVHLGPARPALPTTTSSRTTAWAAPSTAILAKTGRPVPLVPLESSCLTCASCARTPLTEGRWDAPPATTTTTSSPAPSAQTPTFSAPAGLASCAAASSLGLFDAETRILPPSARATQALPSPPGTIS